MNLSSKEHPLPSLESIPAHECGEQAGQAEDVVEMAVGDENVVQVSEAEAGLQDLTPGALTAVNEEAEFVMLDDLRRADGVETEVPRKTISNIEVIIPVVPSPLTLIPKMGNEQMFQMHQRERDDGRWKADD